MRAADVLVARFDEIAQVVAATVDSLDESVATRRLTAGSNTISWLVWHLSRVQDDHVAAVAGREQVWTAGGWASRFALPFADAETGYGFDADQVGQVRCEPQALGDYHAGVHAATVAYVASLGDDDLDAVVDTSWDPPVTLGVRLGSVIGDDLQHAGQALFLRGVFEAPGA